jgi:hypothetical protein
VRRGVAVKRALGVARDQPARQSGFSPLIVTSRFGARGRGFITEPR